MEVESGRGGKKGERESEEERGQSREELGQKGL